MARASLIALLCAFAVCSVVHPVQAARNKLLLVSFDGFRADYLDRKLMPTLSEFRQSGSSVSYVIPNYPSVTFACHYTIATGRHAEHHGIVANTFFDPILNDTFDRSRKEQVWWNYNGTLPVWITAKMHGLRVGIYFYPGSEVAFTVDGDTYRPDFWEQYDQKVPFQQRADSVVDWLSKDNVDFAVLYHWEPDTTGHLFGPDTSGVNDSLVTVDANFGYLMRRIEDSGLREQLDIVVVSDHGMQSIRKTLFLDKDFNIPSSHYRAYQNGPVLTLDATSSGNLTDIYEKLKASTQVAVYYKHQVPPRFNYQSNPRIAQIVVMANPGVCVKPPGDPCGGGNHGYDNQLDTMRAMFMASGPSFNKAATIGPIRQTDIYPLLTHLLAIPAQAHDGNFDSIKAVLMTSQLSDGNVNSNNAPETSAAAAAAACFNSGFIVDVLVPIYAGTIVYFSRWF